MITEEESSFESWDPDKFAHRAQYQKTLRTFSSSLIHGDVLDVGCGSRIYYDLQHTHSWTGIDVSKRMIDGIVFEDEVENKQIMQGDVLDMSFDDGVFDTVIANFLLHHLARGNRTNSAKRVQKAFDEVFRVLRPGGRFVIAENCQGPLEIPYHLLFSPLYHLAYKLKKIELPYFWKTKNFVHFGAKAGFQLQPLYVHIPIVESIYQPVTGVKTPAFMNGPLIQKMTLFEFVKK